MLLPSPVCLPCATFRSPHTAAVFHFVIGCWQITGLPFAAARPLICHGPLYRLLMLLPGPQCAWVPVPSIAVCVSIATLPCATFRSPHTAAGFHFV
ncbi:unnamed protein product, partial [Staurois parvus]